MKIKCEVCEKAEAEVLCCADEAVLCSVCDSKVHAANKLSRKHQRVSLLKYNHNSNNSSSSSSNTAATSSSSSQLPACDICQERNGYFFCLEDRAILCRQCDMSIHMASPFMSSHQRFLIGGIKVALESSANSNSNSNMTEGEGEGEVEGRSFSNTGYFPTPTADEERRQAMTVDSSPGGAVVNLATPASSWPFDDILDNDDFNYYEFSEMESSRIN